MRTSNSNGNFWRGRGVLIANLVLLGLAIWGFAGEYWRSHDLRSEIQRLQGETQAMEQKNFELARLSQGFSSDDMLEREARLNLGLQKPGESVIIVQGGTTAPVHAELSENTVPDAAPTDQNRLANVQKWWRYLFPPKDSAVHDSLN